jgi:hypothetical protein
VISFRINHRSISYNCISYWIKSYRVFNKRNIKLIALTFNEYNKNLIQVFQKRRLGETKERIKTRQPHHLFYNNLTKVEFPVTIQYTKQWVIYETLDSTFNFNWENIAYKD